MRWNLHESLLRAHIRAGVDLNLIVILLGHQFQFPLNFAQFLTVKPLCVIQGSG
jgi:hypothetical protein